MIFALTMKHMLTLTGFTRSIQIPPNLHSAIK
jgi:hypothetical protein